VIGTVLWIIFILLLFFKLRKVYPLMAKDKISAYIGVSLFLIVVYLWSLSFFYLPNLAVFALTYIMTGALIAFLAGEGAIRDYHSKFSGGPVTSFVFTPLVVVIIVAALSGGVLLFRQGASVAAYNAARIAVSNGNTNQAEIAINRAIMNNDRDIYERFLSSLALLELQQLAGKQNTNPQDALQQADKLVTLARTSAERAVALDPTNFENQVSLGAVYDTLGVLGVQGTVDSARNAYLKALELNPKSPRILFLLARVDLVAGNRANAKSYLNRALAERPNFLEAISLLTQLEIQDKNVNGAITAVRNGVTLEPTNFLLRFALGYLYFANKDYPSATVEFESAVYLNPVYADAKYFLGLTYARTNRNQDAVRQFEGVKELNPDNKDVEKILSNLKQGREPFDAGVVAPSQPVDDALSGLESSGSR
jgi:tetratricopeptide (TPR) repeat protein